MMTSLLILVAVLTVGRVHSAECPGDERIPQTGFFNSFMEYFRHHETPAELKKLDQEQADFRKQDILYYIVHEKCLPSKQKGNGSGQCHVVDENGGCAILQTPSHDAHFLAIPLTHVTGIEDPSLLTANSANYFNCAWNHRNTIGSALNKTIARENLILAINSYRGRSQDQLHVHMGCVSSQLKDFFQRRGEEINPRWTTLYGDPHSSRGTRYMKIERETLEGYNPFQVLNDDLMAQGKSGDMENHALSVIGATFANGKPGFYLVDDWQTESHGDGGPSINRNLGLCPGSD